MTVFKRSPLCLVTGATGGIGRATAAGLVAAGARVIVAGRSPQRVAGTVAALGGPDRAEGVVADLSVQADVRALASRVREQYGHLDVLINNAAAGGARRELTADGVERTWAVSYLAPFLLTTLLIDVLTASAPARVVNVTSAAQAMGRLDLADVGFVRRRYRPFAAYAQAKLALVLFTVELAGRLDGTGVTVNSVHPGGARTNMGGQLDARGPAAWGARLTWLLSRSPEVAAHGTVRLATAPEAGGTGGYLVNRPGKAPKPGRANRLAHDADVRRALWELSERMVRRPGRFTS